MAHLKKKPFRAAFLCNYESTIVNQAMLFVNKLSCLKPSRLLSRTIVHPLNHQMKIQAYVMQYQVKHRQSSLIVCKQFFILSKTL